MKKSIKRLTLNRETLRTLTADTMGEVAGGIDTSLQYSRCDNSCGIACTVRNLTCTCADA